MGSSSLWMLVFVVVRDLCTAYYNLNFMKFLLVLFLVMILINCFRKSVLVLVQLFLRVTHT